MISAMTENPPSNRDMIKITKTSVPYYRSIYFSSYKNLTLTGISYNASRLFDENIKKLLVGNVTNMSLDLQPLLLLT